MYKYLPVNGAQIEARTPEQQKWADILARSGIRQSQPAELAQLQSEEDQLKRRQEWTQRLMQHGMQPANGNPLLAFASGVMSLFKGGKDLREIEGSLAENAKKRVEVEGQAKQAELAAKRAEREQQHAWDLEKIVAAEKAKRDNAPRTYDSGAGGWIDPVAGTFTAVPEAQKFMLEKTARGRAVTNVNMPSQANETAFQKALGEKDAGAFVAMRDQAIAARNTMEQAGKVEEILNAQQTGKVQEALAIAGQWFGTEAGANLQALRGAIQPIVLSQVKQLGTGAGITNADREFIERGMPGFGQDPRANAKVLEIMRKTSQRSIDQYTKAQDYVNANGTLAGFVPDMPIQQPQAQPQQPPTKPKGLAEMSDDEILAGLGVTR